MIWFLSQYFVLSWILIEFICRIFVLCRGFLLRIIGSILTSNILVVWVHYLWLFARNKLWEFVHPWEASIWITVYNVYIFIIPRNASVSEMWYQNCVLHISWWLLHAKSIVFGLTHLLLYLRFHLFLDFEWALATIDLHHLMIACLTSCFSFLMLSWTKHSNLGLWFHLLLICLEMFG